MGFHPTRAAAWVGARHLSGAGALGAPPPRLHLRRESNFATWLSLAWQAGADGGAGTGGMAGRGTEAAAGSSMEQQPGGPYLATGDVLDEAEWTTFYPFDEHGCKSHVRGAEGDSTGRVHGSPPITTLLATVDTSMP